METSQNMVPESNVVGINTKELRRDKSVEQCCFESILGSSQMSAQPSYEGQGGFDWVYCLECQPHPGMLRMSFKD